MSRGSLHGGGERWGRARRSGGGDRRGLPDELQAGRAADAGGADADAPATEGELVAPGSELATARDDSPGAAGAGQDDARTAEGAAAADAADAYAAYAAGAPAADAAASTPAQAPSAAAAGGEAAAGDGGDGPGMPADGLLPISSCQSTLEAEALAQRLVDAGIPAMPRVGRHPGGLPPRVEVVVPAQLYEAACEALEPDDLVDEGDASLAEIEAALHSDEPPLPTNPQRLHLRPLPPLAWRWIGVAFAVVALYCWLGPAKGYVPRRPDEVLPVALVGVVLLIAFGIGIHAAAAARRAGQKHPRPSGERAGGDRLDGVDRRGDGAVADTASNRLGQAAWIEVDHFADPAAALAMADRLRAAGIAAVVREVGAPPALGPVYQVEVPAPQQAAARELLAARPRRRRGPRA